MLASDQATTSRPETWVRKRIRQALPDNLLSPTPLRGLWFLVWLSIIGASWYALFQEPGVILSFVLAIVIGQAFASLGFLGHEASHGSITKTPWLKTLLAGIGFAPFLVSPGFWHRWHNIVHHGNTNMGDKDPDSFGNLKRYKRNPKQKSLVQLAPGSGRWYSYFFLFYSFTLHSQAVLWFQTKHRKAFKGFNRKAAIFKMFLLLTGWVALGAYMGLSTSFWGILLPMAFGNFIIQSYILTNHFLRPQTESNNPVDNSMSVNTLGILDKLHYNFSHHVEHHLFPTMPGSRAPLVKQWLKTHLPNSYVSPSHAKAIYYLYKTPRVYASPNSLINVENGKVLNLDEIQNKLRPNYQSLQHWLEDNKPQSIPA